MAQTVLHKENMRGHANHGWLDAHHTFSFASFYNPEMMNFGALRVLNDDHVAGGKGFGQHPHDNMEIITILLEGSLAHKDSMGNASVIKKGDIQVMSAGSGISHSEYNADPNNPVKLLQIWLFPNKKNVTPRYGQTYLDLQTRSNEFVQVLSPNQDDVGVWIHQDAWFHLGRFEKGKEMKYDLKKAGNGVYFFIISGKATVDGQELNKRDGFGIWDTNAVNFKSEEGDTEVLIMEVPMEI